MPELNRGDPESTGRFLAERWGKMTLEEFRRTASKHTTGMVFEQLRHEDGTPLVIAVCVDGAHEVQRIDRLFNFVGDEVSADWTTMTLAQLALRSCLGTGLDFESLRDANRVRTALVVIAASPASTTMIGMLFGSIP